MLFHKNIYFFSYNFFVNFSCILHNVLYSSYYFPWTEFKQRILILWTTIIVRVKLKLKRRCTTVFRINFITFVIWPCYYFQIFKKKYINRKNSIVSNGNLKCSMLIIVDVVKYCRSRCQKLWQLPQFSLWNKKFKKH